MQTLKNLPDFLSRDSSALANTVLDPCPECGRRHPTPFRTIRNGRGGIVEVPQLVEKILGHKPQRAVLIYDRAIEQVIFPAVVDPMRAGGLAVEAFGMAGEPGHLLDSGSLNGNQAADDIGPTADILIAAGSGVICDLTKWIATRLGKPFVLCGTAPSMNGYTSITATITQNDIKISEFLNPADAVLLDANILKDAPMPMIRAGMGDLAARAICNADWKLGSLLRGSTFCSLPYQMTAENERRYLAAAAGIAARQPEAIEQLSEAILLSGLSMTILEGETSPSSGAEHVLSHFWDLLVYLRGAHKNLHGTQVGVGTLIMCAAYQYIREINPAQIDPRSVLRRRPSLEAVEAENVRLYADKAEAFNAVAREKRIPDADLPAYIRRIQDGWEEMWQAIDPYVAPIERIAVPFAAAGVPSTLAEIQRTPEQAKEALLHGSHYRPRYTLLDLLWELGLFPDAADEILERARVL